jgi:hypothetical protein
MTLGVNQYENIADYKYHPEFQLYGKKKIRKVKPTKMESILIPANKLQELNRLLSSNDYEGKKRIMIRKLAGGTCHACSGIPTKKLSFDVKGASVIECYCNSCFDKL